MTPTLTISETTRRAALAAVRLFLMMGSAYSVVAAVHASELDASAEHVVEDYAQPDQSNNIRLHLERVAAEVTDHSLDGLDTLEKWQNARDERRRQLIEMLGLDNVPMDGERPPLNVRVTGVLQKEGYRVEKLYYESLPGLYVPANLYVPDGIEQPVPAVLYVCGHSGTQKVHYQAHLRKLVQLGFVAMVIETLQYGEVRGEHGGTYRRGWFHWLSLGYNPGGVEAWNGIRALDVLCQRPEVDARRLGVTGNSGGGGQSWYLAALDDRIRAAAPSCGAGTVESHLRQRTIDGHCDCMMPNNTYLQDFQNIGALIAPRPLLIAEADRDHLYAIESVRRLHQDVAAIYRLYGAPEAIGMVEAHGPHGYDALSRTTIFSFFVRHLMGREIPPDQIGDFDESPEATLTADELRVYVDGPPADDRTKTIQESFVQLPAAPVVETEAQWRRYRDRVVAALKAQTFRAFPDRPVPLNPRFEFRARDPRASWRPPSPFSTEVYSFVSETDWRLEATVRWRGQPGDAPQTLIVLRNPDDRGRFPSDVVQPPDETWNIVYLETRGTGETGWNPDQQWHIRRAAAWTGRTVASMRVYDVLRCLEFVRGLPGVNPDQIGIAASGEMAVVAMYVALLDGRISTVILKDPPATQNAPSSPDGKGPAIEMLNCLRIADLPQIAGLLYPARLDIVGAMPPGYRWAQAVYETLGAGGKFTARGVAQ